MNAPSVSSPHRHELSVSVVVYRPDPLQLERTLTSLGAACARLRAVVPAAAIELCLVDNGGLGECAAMLGALEADGVETRLLAGHGNVGYGRGHNLAIESASSRFHLVLNPDIDLDADALAIALDFFAAHPDVGLISPRIGDADGNRQYLCRRFPTVLDLFVRGFLPRSLRGLFERRLARYEMRDQINDRDVVWEPAIVSGCFMLFRTGVLRQLGGFDPRYFLYFEDYDLSLRTHDVARVAYVPAARVLHFGGGAGRKGWAHIRMFCRSAFQFFNRFGWRLM
ncbi:MAG: glycosyltransferase family 2 protein [Burkholderia gladioli]